ncbi:hypothetical protein DYB32_008221 [Aphanomyces invadans]|uniref:Serine/threonine-protein kinase PLK n=1 Tax=Aphanomyces invadans TaxID=157072 RepID=A0A3R6WH59_9STRA|nr:hypothetical protein DYB32_008221 [Aphanomyces invadans]
MADLQRTITELCVDEQGHESTRTYTRHRFLGKGGFARCYEITNDATGAKFAGKIVEKQSLVKPKARLKFTSEIRIHRTLQHHRVVQFKHYFEDDANCYMLLELCSNQRLSEHEVRYYIHQLIEGVAYLHSRCVIHRDLKLGNLFLTADMQLKIGDFGLASMLDSREEKRRTMCGTPNYIAPEILNGHHNSGHSFEVDIWSTGVVMYTLLVGKPPFETKDVKNTYKLIRANDYSFPPHISISANAKALVMDLLQKDPTQRPSIGTILAHPFLQEAIPDALPDSAMFLTPPPISKSSARHRSPLTPLIDSNVPAKASRPPPGTPSSHEARPLQAGPLRRASLSTSQDGKRVSPRPSYIDTLDAMADTLSTAFFLAAGENAENVAGRDLLQAKLRASPCQPATLWVLQFVDYTSKYGLGYLLSNQCTGVYFNDATKIIANSTTFGYVTKPPDQAMDSPQSVHNLAEYPRDLTKKVTLLGHFKEFIEAEACEEAKTLQRNLLLDLPSIATPMVYVSKWHKTRHCMMFRLTNDTVQANFFDTTKLVLSDGGAAIT